MEQMENAMTAIYPVTFNPVSKEKLDNIMEAVRKGSVIAFKFCSQCLDLKPMSEFQRHDVRKRGQCKKCRNAYIHQWNMKNKQKRKQYTDKWNAKNIVRRREIKKVAARRDRKSNPGKFYVWWLRGRCRRYGVTVEWFQKQIELQRGLCAICSQPPKANRLAIDHCHETGIVRGLLCSPCNTALHKMERDIEWVRAAESYLAIKWQEQQ